MGFDRLRHSQGSRAGVRRNRVHAPSRAQRQRSMMRLGHLPGQGKPEPDAFGLARDERLEQGLGQLGGGPGPGVADLDDRARVVIVELESSPRRPARRPRSR